MELNLNNYIFQALCSSVVLLIGVLSFVARGTFKRLDKIDDKLEPLKVRVSLTESDIKNMNEKHHKLEQDHRLVHDKIFLILDKHENLISKIGEHKK